MDRPAVGAFPTRGDRPLRGPCALVFGKVRPMLAHSAQGPFDGPDWLFEVKWDGYRAVAFLEGNRTRLQSRNLKDLTGSYPTLAELHKHLDGTHAVIDGEIVALREGRPDFQTLQRGTGPVIYVAFDILELDGRTLTRTPLAERKQVLTGKLGRAPELIHSRGVMGQGEQFYRAAVESGLEGVVAKRLDSLYHPGRRTRDWLKVRNVRKSFALVTGYTRGADARPFGSLVLGVLDDGGRLIYAGHVGTGFDEREMLSLVEHLGPPAGCPLAGGEPRRFRGRVTWVEPRHVVEVEYLEWTREGRLRHPVYRGLRPDKDACDCTAASAGCCDSGRAAGAGDAGSDGNGRAGGVVRKKGADR